MIDKNVEYERTLLITEKKFSGRLKMSITLFNGKLYLLVIHITVNFLPINDVINKKTQKSFRLLVKNQLLIRDIQEFFISFLHQNLTALKNGLSFFRLPQCESMRSLRY